MPTLVAWDSMNSYSSNLEAILGIFCSMAEYQQSMVIHELQAALTKTRTQRPLMEIAAKPAAPARQQSGPPRPKPKLRSHQN